jgi:hypothetical protein
MENAMNVVKLYLPLRDNSGNAFDARMFKDIEQELSQRFGGVTAHMQAPANGLWREGDTTHADEIVIFEVILKTADRTWWTQYRERLEVQFRQKSVMVFLQEIEVL